MANKEEKKISKQEFEENFALLKTFHTQSFLDMAEIKQLEKEINYWLELDDMKWKQRATREWYKGGNKNTKFFYTCSTQRHKHNNIKKIKNHNGVDISSQEDIEEVFRHYFQIIYNSSNSSALDTEKGTKGAINKVTTKMNNYLTSPFLKEEVEMALKQMAPLKSPGLDGFNISFYQTYSHIVGEEVTFVVLKFLNKGLFNRGINFTYIVLIPKIKKPVNTSDFRPINLCNFIYKLVSKTLVNCLKLLIPTIISKTWRAFILGQLIIDHIITA